MLTDLPAEFDRKGGYSAAWQRGARGQGVRVAVIDAALDPDDPRLAGSVVDNRAFIDGAGPPAPDSHGTRIAQLIKLIAPDCEIVGCNIVPAEAPPVWDLGFNGRIRDAAVAAIAHSRSPEVGARVINMSFAVPRGRLFSCRPEHRCRLCTAVNAAREAGVLPFAAAGNKGEEGVEVECPGCAEGAVTVAAIISQREQEEYDRGGDRSRFGTSFSSAYAAGGAALLFSALPEATPDQVAAATLRTAQPLPGVPREAQGAGRVHYGRALDYLIGPTDIACQHAREALHFLAGNADAQHSENAYLNQAVETALAYAEHNLLRRGERGEAAALLAEMRKSLLADRLPAVFERIAALERRLH